MIKNRARFIFQYLRNRKAIFIERTQGDYLVYAARNRAARNFLKSNKIQNLAKANSCKIEHGEHISIIY